MSVATAFVLAIGVSTRLSRAAEAGFKTALVRAGMVAEIDDAGLAAALASAMHRPDLILPRLLR